MKLKILYDIDGWAYHRRACMLQTYLPSEFETTRAPLHATDVASVLGCEPPDLIFLLAQKFLGPLREALRERDWRPKLVVAWNCGWSRRREQFDPVYHAADAIVFNNEGYWAGMGRPPRTFMIPNGVDLSVFSPRAPIRDRAPKVLWVGSKQYSRLKGYYDFMLPLRDAFTAQGLAFDLMLVDSWGGATRSAEEMAAWYNEGTVLVCASESEGTPNPALEAAACGCTLVSTPVGNMPQLIHNGSNGYLVKRELSALRAGISAACNNYVRLAEQMQQDIQAWNIRERSRDYAHLFQTILNTSVSLQD